MAGHDRSSKGSTSELGRLRAALDEARDERVQHELERELFARERAALEQRLELARRELAGLRRSFEVARAREAQRIHELELRLRRAEGSLRSNKGGAA